MSIKKLFFLNFRMRMSDFGHGVWVCHMIYFIFGVKTLKIQQKSLDFNEKP